MIDEPLPQSEIILYQTDEGGTRVQVRLQDETVWLTQKPMAELFGKEVRTINEHIQNPFEEEELAEYSVIRKFRITAADGKSYARQHFNLDVIISVGYRVKSLLGTQFRIWATQRLRENIVKGFTMDDGRLKQSTASVTRYRGRIPLISRIPGCSSLPLLDPWLNATIPSGIKNSCGSATGTFSSTRAT